MVPSTTAFSLPSIPRTRLPFASPGPEVYRDEQEREFALLGRLNRLSAVKYPDDPALRARIKSYELAFRMQMAVPEVMQFRERDRHERNGCMGWTRM